ncbi:GNAT family N-acetyltransferase [Gynuella sunshinyii]|uniref:N-acetylglutamate synthase and related acetyltransferase n=1 Tax=Gynuella sunshinyii YC6258 TaxID=1445510 RepID=A0A0C5W0U9_9GAMM|nr:GNAT family N-acetyltransferase [Gynuella sunshinyii]AJQ96299.1 N-acetylglutamate synthase and related acetyltransferase [Gynuella sunshinyii YC6258]
MEISEVVSIAGLEQQLVELLIDAVASGASIGFIAPLAADDAAAYWRQVSQELSSKERKMYVAMEQGNLAGVVQLALCGKANGQHRAEVEKLMVHTRERGKGVGKELMKYMEQQARELGRDLLVLDTRVGDTASYLYRKLEYIEAGQIPQFALSSAGTLDGTVYFYKLLN